MKKIYLLAALAAIVLSSCNQRYYAPLMYKQDVAYQFKPLSTDSSKNATYVSGGIRIGSGTNQSDEVIMGLVSVDRGHTFENLNLAYGGYGFYGNYQNTSNNDQTSPGYFQNKDAIGFGLRASANVFVATERADFRIIGIAASYSQESGSYSDFRKDAQNKYAGFYTDANNSLFTAGFTNETAWHMSRDKQVQFGYRVFLGSVIGNHTFANNVTSTSSSSYSYDGSSNSRIAVAASYFMQIHKYNFVAEVHNFDSFSINFGYRF